jgi:hypothetical protein
MKRQIEEVEKDLGRKLTELEYSLVLIGLYRGQSIGYEKATDEAIKLLNKK